MSESYRRLGVELRGDSPAYADHPVRKGFQSSAKDAATVQPRQHAADALAPSLTPPPRTGASGAQGVRDLWQDDELGAQAASVGMIAARRCGVCGGRWEFDSHPLPATCPDCGSGEIGVNVLGPVPGEHRPCDVCATSLRAERVGGVYLGPPLALDVGGRGLVVHAACAIEGVARAGEEMAQMSAAGDMESDDTWAERWAAAWEVAHG